MSPIVNNSTIQVNSEALTRLVQDHLGKDWYALNVYFSSHGADGLRLWNVEAISNIGEQRTLHVEASIINAYDIVFRDERMKLKDEVEKQRIQMEYSDEALTERLFEERS